MCDDNSSVGYLVLSSLGDPLVETWKFSPSHHGTRPDPSLVGRMVVSSLATTSPSSSIKSTSLRISLKNSKNNVENIQNDRGEETGEADSINLQEHFLHIFAMEFFVANTKFISVVLRIISKNVNNNNQEEHKEGRNNMKATETSSKSWCDACTLSIWFTSILIIDWLSPLVREIESISQNEHKEEKFTTEKVLNNTTQKQQQKGNDQDENIVLNKVIRMFHSDSLLLMMPTSSSQNGYFAEHLPEMSLPLNSYSNNNNKSASPSIRRDPPSPASINNKSNNTSVNIMMNSALSPAARSTKSASPAASGKMKFDNSLSVCHETFLVALRTCLIKSFDEEQKENEKKENSKEDEDEKKKRQKKLKDQRTNGKAVTAEADIILNDLQQQIFVKQQSSQSVAIDGVALVNIKNSKSSWLLQPRFTRNEADDDVDENKWKFTICPRLLKLIEGKTNSAFSAQKQEKLASSKLLDHVEFNFFNEKIHVVANEVRVEQDEKEFFSSVSLFGNSDEWKVVIVGLKRN